MCAAESSAGLNHNNLMAAFFSYLDPRLPATYFSLPTSLRDESSLCFPIAVVDFGSGVGGYRFADTGIETLASFRLGKKAERALCCTKALESYGHENNNEKS